MHSVKLHNKTYIPSNNTYYRRARGEEDFIYMRLSLNNGNRFVELATGASFTVKSLKESGMIPLPVGAKIEVIVGED